MVVLVIFPVAGWLADTRIGRYRFVHFSMWWMWLAVLATSVLLLVQAFTNATLNEWPFDILIGIGLLGVAGFQASAIQLGIDQLVDASSGSLSAYISWYIWSFFVSKCAIVLTQSCACSWKYQPDIVMLLLPISCTLSLATNGLLSKWLIKEPVVQDPFRVIFRVLKYALKHKHPQMRSAFTFWEDEPYTRIDLGKSKYGGPYSTEEVEDVKMFCRILKTVALFSLFGGTVCIVNELSTKRMSHYRNGDFLVVSDCIKYSSSENLRSCYEMAVLKDSQYFILALLIPFLEFVLYPLLMKLNCQACVYSRTLDRSLVGVAFGILYIAYVLTLEATSTLIMGHVNVTCSLDEPQYSQSHVLNTDFRWLIPSNFFFSLSVYFLITCAAELVCAQAPYSMKGILNGMNFSLCSISVMISYGIMVAIRELSKLGNDYLFEAWCGVWYYLATLLIDVILSIVLFIWSKKYKLRRRDENVHNEQIFAVDYFEKYLQA